MGLLEGSVVIVTGAGRGIGFAIAQAVVAEGGVAVLTDRNDTDGEAAARAVGGTAEYRHLDVASESEWNDLVRAVLDVHGRIDGLVNNAAISSHDGQPCDFATVPVDHIRDVLEINVMGSIFGIRAVAPIMIAAGRGAVVNFSSTGGFRAVGGFGPYATSKFAVRGLTKAFAAELGVHGIRVNSVHPGHVLTPMRARAIESDESVGRITSTKPLTRDGEPEEIANLTTFLLSDRSSYCTGTEFVADGGLLAGTRPASA